MCCSDSDLVYQTAGTTNAILQPSLIPKHHHLLMSEKKKEHPVITPTPGHRTLESKCRYPGTSIILVCPGYMCIDHLHDMIPSRRGVGSDLGRHHPVFPSTSRPHLVRPSYEPDYAN